MVRRSFRRGLRLGLLIGAVVAVVKVVQSWRAAEEPPLYVAPPSPWPVVERKPEAEPVMEAATFAQPHPEVATQPATAPTSPRRERPLKASPAPAKKRATSKPVADERIWVTPSGGVCPPSHPIKAKLSSKLFHLPGMFAYDRCKPDRCYATETGAVADGLTKAKR